MGTDNGRIVKYYNFTDIFRWGKCLIIAFLREDSERGREIRRCTKILAHAVCIFSEFLINFKVIQLEMQPEPHTRQAGCLYYHIYSRFSTFLFVKVCKTPWPPNFRAPGTFSCFKTLFKGIFAIFWHPENIQATQFCLPTVQKYEVEIWYEDTSTFRTI